MKTKRKTDNESKKSKPSPLETMFAEHLACRGIAAASLNAYIGPVRQFLRHVGSMPIEKISEADTRAFFDTLKKISTRRQYGVAIAEFLQFATSRLPVPVNARGGLISPPAVKSKKEIALRQKWSVDKLREEKENSDDLIARLARKVIDHYVFFQTLLKTDEVDLDTVSRFADECRELIETNLPLFMSLSAQGRNIHSAIDERVQR